MIFYRQAWIFLTLLMCAFTLGFTRLKRAPVVIKEVSTTLCQEGASLVELNKNSSSDFLTGAFQQREGVLREVFSKPFGLSVFAVKAEESVLKWNEKGLSEEMVDVEGSFGEVTFSSNHLVWDKLSYQVVLSDQVAISLKSFGDLFTKERVVMTFDETELKRVECFGQTTLDFFYGASPLRLSCVGLVVLDPLEAVVTWVTTGDEQIHLSDKNTHIFADQMIVSYDKEGINLKSCALSGHVKLVNGEKGGSIALADELTYCTKTNELYLTGKENRRVLFSDEENQFEMSAEAVRFKKSTPAQKGYIQGLGDVRFLLGSKEREHLFKLFSFILETAVRGGKEMQNFELESVTMGGDHSQKAKISPVVTDSSSKDCVNSPSLTAVSRVTEGE